MIETWDKNKVYRTAVSPGWRENLLMYYKEYQSLVSSLEEFVSSRQTKVLASLGAQRIYGDEEESPWAVEVITTDDKENYEKFVSVKPVDENNHNCYVSLDLTAAKGREQNSKVIFSTPVNYSSHRHRNSLPHRIERYTAAYKDDENLSDAAFIINGKYKVVYTGGYGNRKLAEVFEDENFEQEFICMLDVVAQFTEEPQNIKSSELTRIHTEAMVSALTAPFEYMILDSLSLLAETSNKIIKDVIGKRTGPGYLSQAEKEGLLPSAVALQDYLNIRNLMYHQWDSLDGIGKFNEIEFEKNNTIRRRFLDSYDKLCDMPLSQRIEAYKKVAEDFIPLISVLNTHFVAKQKMESNSKFFKRIKETIEEQSDRVVYVDTQTAYGDKKSSIIKNLEKIFPDIVIVDKSMANTEKVDCFTEKLNNFLYRRKYLEIFQSIEYKVCQYCLFMGKNYTPTLAWDFCRRHRMINIEEYQRWAEYKKLRNELSHRYLDTELYNRMVQYLPLLVQDSVDLNQRFQENWPQIRLLKDSIFRAMHKNGITVDIDFAQNKVVNIITPGGNSIQPTTQQKTDNNKKQRRYTEEYDKGISITLSDTDITTCRLNNGIEIDYEKKYVKFDDGTKMYFDRPGRCFFTIPSGEKLIIDDQLKVIKYICRGKSVNIGRSESCTFMNRRIVRIGRDYNLEEDSWHSMSKQKRELHYTKTPQGFSMNLNDGTKLIVEKTNIKVLHQDIELTYQNRKNFANSYIDAGQGVPQYSKER